METLVVFFVTSVFGITAWGLRLEGRVNGLDQRTIDLEKLMNVRCDAIEQRLERIERKLDASNGKIH
jgi:hypothetical protein